jgi:hypothetical protein
MNQNFPDTTPDYMQEFRKQALINSLKNQTNQSSPTPDMMQQNNPNIGIQQTVNSPTGQDQSGNAINGSDSRAIAKGSPPISSAPSGRLIAPISWFQGLGQLSQAADPQNKGNGSSGSNGMMGGLMNMASSFFL